MSINTPLDEPSIIKLPAAYRTAIVRNLLGLLEGRLVYYEPLHIVTKHICGIFIPKSLRHIIFNLMHATPVARNMGGYTTLYRIRLRFFLALLTF